MRVLAGGAWNDGYLDYARGEDGVRVQVSAIVNLEALNDVFFVRARSVRMVWNYLREVGPRAVWLRVRSRMAESGRNEKYVSCGLGVVVEAPAGGPAVGTPVVFIAPSHPACAERLVLPAALVAAAEGGEAAARTGAVLRLAASARGERWWSGVRGWTPDSGVPLDAAACAAMLGRASETLRAAEWTRAEALAVDAPSPVAERAPAAAGADGRKTAVLFGYGNYAKVTLLPHVERFLRLSAVHEIDPTQLPRERRADVAWDTSGVLRGDERPDAVLIAGYHHTHAPLAVETLARGAYAVVEKPLVTTRAQLDALEAALRRSPRMFACFQKRYLRFNAMALEDLGVGPGEPVNYHCVVYEIPLPELHWYRWPSSRTRLVSNGCHWIDHFLFLNGFSEPRAWDLAAGPDGTLNVTVVLENGAFFSMVLTDRGSERIGMQEHVELRANDRTVRIENGSEYYAESTRGVLRRARANRLDVYGVMYRTIARAVAEGRPGDSLESVLVASRLVLALEERLAQVAGAAFGPAPSAREAGVPAGRA
ncbi:Gfo/Idh/MocA family protein [Longimicrobium sp.]|uniref:Gfo/Idh/MocA family protein n=1 Tax=Longimicrobium sp. TaxID=2029185 RepID=UPI003B3BD98D